MADGHTHLAPRNHLAAAEASLARASQEVPAFAQHSFGIDRWTGAFKPWTKVTLDRAGRRFVCGEDRFVEDGELLVLGGHSSPYHLTLIEPEYPEIVAKLRAA